MEPRALCTDVFSTLLERSLQEHMGRVNVGLNFKSSETPGVQSRFKCRSGIEGSHCRYRHITYSQINCSQISGSDCKSELQLNLHSRSDLSLQNLKVVVKCNLLLRLLIKTYLKIKLKKYWKIKME